MKDKEMSYTDLFLYILIVIGACLGSYNLGVSKANDKVIEATKLAEQASGNTLKCIDTLYEAVK